MPVHKGKYVGYFCVGRGTCETAWWVGGMGGGGGGGRVLSAGVCERGGKGWGECVCI